MHTEPMNPTHARNQSLGTPDVVHDPLAPLLLSETDAAKLLGISARSVFSLCASGQLPVVRINRRKLIDRRDVEALIARAKTGSGGSAKIRRWRNNPPPPA